MPEVDTSDADGLVQAVWTLGERPGRQRSSVAVDGQPPIATSLAADAEPVPGTVRVVMGDVPTGLAGTELSESVVATVVDTGGAPLGDVAVSWETDAGSIVAEASRTDSLGNARARWTFGPRAGPQRAYVRVGGSRNGPRSAVTATALPGSAAALTVARRSTLRGVAGRSLADLELRATDGHGNPVPEVRVSLRPSQGTVAERDVVTDSTGRARPIWILGTAAGVQRLTASADGMPAPLEIAVKVTAGAPAKVALEGVPAAGTVGRPLPQTVRAVVSDAHGNPAAGVSVVFSTKTGTLAPTRAHTDSAGRAQTRWTLSPRAGDQVLEAVVKEGGARGVAHVRGIRSRRGS